MLHLVCATCDGSALRPPRLVGGAWYALCSQCLFETEVDAIGVTGAGDPKFRVKGAAGLTARQEADLRRPRPLA